MADDVVGSVSVNIVPSAENFNRDAQRTLGPQADELGKSLAGIIGRQISQGIADGVKSGLKEPDVQAPARTQGTKAGKSFGESLKASLRAAMADLPKIKIDADSSSADLALSNLQTRMEALSNKTIGVDIDANAAKAELDDIKAKLTELGQQSSDISVQVDTAKAAADLDRFSAQVDRIAAQNATIRVEADTARAVEALAQVGIEAEAVAGEHPTVTVGVDATRAEEALAAVGIEAEVIAREHPTITVDADTAGADAEIAATGAAAAAASGSGGVGGLITAAIGLSPVLVAVGAVGVGAFAAIGAAAAAVGAAMGVALLALKPIMDAYQALNAQKTSSSSAGGASQAAAIEAANAQMVSSERNLANTRANVADQAVQAAQKVKDAQRSLVDAERSAAEQIKNAEQGVAQARSQAAQQQQTDLQNLSSARQQAAQADQQAENQVTSAEQSLSAAQAAAVLAQQNLNAARQQAVKDLQQMAFSAADAALSQRQAQLNLEQAQQNYASVMNSKKSTALQKEQAALALAQAKQALLEQTQAAKDAAAANTKAQKGGIEGDSNVVAAKKAVQQANQNVINQQKALLDAQKNLVQTQVAGAKAIAAAQDKLARDQIAAAQAIQKAEQGLADAKYNGARSVQKAHEAVSQAQASQHSQARQGANQVAQATDAVTAAQRAQEKAHQSTGSTATSSANKVAKAMAALSPAGKKFLDYIMSIKSGFGDLSKTAQNGFLPGLEKGMKALGPLMKPIKRLVDGLSKAMGGIAESAGKAIGGPEGQKFVNFLSKNLPKWLTLVAGAAGHFMSGLIKLFEGFGPTATLFLGWLNSGSKAFDKWAGAATKTSAFKSFMAYIAKEGPVIGGIFKNFAVIIGKVAIGLAPLGAKMASALKSVSGFIAGLSPKVLGLIATGIIAIVVGMKAAGLAMKAWGAATKIWSGIQKIATALQWLWDTAMSANPIGLVIIALVALGIAVVIMYKKVGWFRAGVQATWKAIKEAFNVTIHWIVNTAWPWLKGVFNDIKNGFSAVGKWFHDRWKDITKAFTDSVNWVKGAWHKSWNGVTGVITGAFNSAKNGIHDAWEKVKGFFTSAVNWVKGAWNREWKGLEYVFTHPVDAAKKTISKLLGAVGLRKVFSDAVTEIGKVWSGIESKFSKPLDFVKRVINTFITGFNKIGGLVGLHIPKLSIGGTVPAVANGGGHQAPLPKYAGGGVISGPWKGPKADNVLGISRSGIPTAWVNPRERITNVKSSESMDRKHPGVMDYINAHGTLPGFADGGIAPIIKTVAYALAQVGKPYVWGAAGPNAFDCSGLTSAAWKHGANVTIPHLAAAQHREGWPISRSNLFPGDLVFPTVTPGGGIPHVEMYVGKGNVVEAMNPSLGIRGPHPMNGFAGGARRPALLATANASNSGGILAALGNAIAEAAKKGGSLLNGLAGTIFNPIKGFMGSHLGGLKNFAGPFAGKVLPGLAKKLASKAVSWGVNAAESAFSFGSGGTSQAGTGGGVQRWAETIANALSMNKLPTSSRYVDAWLRQVATESSGDPTAIQGSGVVDINSRTGQYARGLLQVVPSTFAAYKFPGHGNIFDALDNSLAAINYAKHRYGAAGMLSVIGHGHGYANGTTNALAGIASVAERGAELVTSPQMRNFRGGETVYNAAQTSRILGGSSAADMAKAFRDGMNGSRMVLDIAGKRTLATVVIDELGNRVSAGVAGGI